MIDAVTESGFDRLGLEDAILTAISNERAGEHPASDRVEILPALHSYMSPDLVANTTGQVMLVHEKPLPAPIWWADYDPDYAQLVFVTVTGQIIPLGLAIPPVIDGYLRKGHEIVLIEIDKAGTILNVQERKLVVRKNGWD